MEHVTPEQFEEDLRCVWPHIKTELVVYKTPQDKYVVVPRRIRRLATCRQHVWWVAYMASLHDYHGYGLIFNTLEEAVNDFIVKLHLQAEERRARERDVSNF